MKSRLAFPVFVVVVLLTWASAGIAAGPLRVHPQNPRYFTDGSGRAVYLTGSHTWANLVDIGPKDPPPALDFDEYLDFLARQHHNFVRLWTWEPVSWNTKGNGQSALHTATPQPHARTGPGKALDGKPKFDLAKYDAEYFERLRRRVQAAQDRGIYVSIMLFEGWAMQFSPGAWRGHPYNPANNVNGINGDQDGDGNGLEIYTLAAPAVTSLQEAYVRKVVDTVNALNNVLYEISNENHPPSTPWQHHVIRFIKEYEKTKPKRHPVGMTFQYKGGSNQTLWDSPADWISPNSNASPPYDYRTNPPPADGKKVVLTDTDHLWGIGGDTAWVWKSFLRGLNPLFMDPYDGVVLGPRADSKWDPIRRNLGYTLRYAERVDLAAMTPRSDLASTKYCLANPAKQKAEYLVYLPEGGNVAVDLTGSEGPLAVEWLDPKTGKTTRGQSVAGGSSRRFAAPFSGDAVLYLGRARLPRLKVSENGRFLVHEDGTPMFWLGDTAWELFHRLNREEAARYLENRAAKGFTVIQAVALAELDGVTTPNAYGHLPLVDSDPTRPAVKDGPSNDYWDQVDYVVAKANSLGLYVGFLPTWGRHWHDKGRNGKPPIFTPANAEVYGEWLGQRYRDAGLVWILGGDRTVENEQHRAVIRAMARGLRRGDGGAHLMTFHPRGASGSAESFHNDDWLDFNMRQNGHAAEFTGRYDQTRVDYDRKPVKPVLDGEPIYEDHPVDFKAKNLGHSIAADVRRPLYWDLFTGAFGHTYGHHSVWQMWAPPRPPVNNPLMPWFEAIDQPGAGQMQYARRLLESRPLLTRVPDDSVIVESSVPTAMPGAGRYRFVATRDGQGSYAMVYAPVGRAFAVRMDRVSGGRVKAWWFNPRNGASTPIGEFDSRAQMRFTPPDAGEMLDWVLVLDDAAKGYPPPGSRKSD